MPHHIVSDSRPTVAVAVVVLIMAVLSRPVEAECDYRFSGRLVVSYAGDEQPLRGVKVRVRRTGGTGASRDYVLTDENGQFDGVWRFDRDQDGIGPGRGDIRFSVQLQLRNEETLKVAKGGWTGTPWDTFAEVEGKDCIQFILQDRVFEADAITVHDVEQRAYIYLVYERLLRRLEAEGVALKNQIEVIYPDRHVYSRDSSWFLQKAHIEGNDWNDVRTLIHEAMHQWDINHLKGELHINCLTDAHHKPPDARGSGRCSGIMEGFAEATAQALYNEIFNNQPFFGDGTFRGPRNHEELRTSTGGSGAVTTLDEAERNDNGWTNFLKFVMWPNVWKPFNESGLRAGCQPLQVPVFELLATLKAEAPGDKKNASFAGFTEVLEGNIGQFREYDSRFYQLLGDPATEASDIHDEMCPDPPGLSNFRSGKLCVDANGDKAVCVEQIDVTVDGADSCGFDGRQVPCTWFGFEFDFQGADPQVPLVCAWERSVPGNMGNIDGIVERDTSSGVGSVLLPSADGHYVYANFQVHSTPPGAVPFQITSEFDCSYAGVALFDVEYRLNIVP